ncbi:MAG: PDZ domain-containing protein [Gammaproteobacteria bacterium]|nr:PDZ domain-containing protein [Gammaproteobacteria bacterium]
MKNICLGIVLMISATLCFAGEYDEEMEAARKALDDAARTLAELHKKKFELGGDARRAMLGILLGDGPDIGGVTIVGTTPDSGAATAGLKTGDLIVKIGDLMLSNVDDPMHQLSKYMKTVTAGDEVAVVYQRNGESRSVSITTQSRSKHILAMLPDIRMDVDSIGDWAGLVNISQELWTSGTIHEDHLMQVTGDLASYFGVESGVIVTMPKANSKLQAGDVILRVDGAQIQDVVQLNETIQASKMTKEVAVELKRHGRVVKVTVALAEFFSPDHRQVHMLRIKRRVPEDETEAQAEIDRD